MGFKVTPSLGMPGHNQTPTALLAARAVFKAQPRRWSPYPDSEFSTVTQPRVAKSDHFVDCSNFKQSLLKMMTRRKRWSNTTASD
jgi:hypothetical protein